MNMVTAMLFKTIPTGFKSSLKYMLKVGTVAITIFDAINNREN